MSKEFHQGFTLMELLVVTGDRNSREPFVSGAGDLEGEGI